MSRKMLMFSAFSIILLFSSPLIGSMETAGSNFRITKIIDNGDPSTHIDLAIIGSGFTSKQIDEYISKANQNIEKMFTVNWFVANKNLFNVWRIDAISPISGVDLDDPTIYSLASQTPYDILIVIHNYDGQESVIKPYVELYKYSHNYVVLAHELGHKIGKLDDEYWTPATAYKCNGLSKRTLNIHDKPNNEKWSGLISTPPFEGARYCEKDLWRPSKTSIMGDSANTKYFDAVGMKAMDLGAGKILGTVESMPPSLMISGVANGDTKSGTLRVEAITSDSSGIERVEFYWAKSGGTSKSIKITRTYPYDLDIDTTKFENGQYYLDTVSYDKKWNYTRKTILFNIEKSKPMVGIPIIVHEALTQDSDYYIQTRKRRNMPGMERVNEPLTVGIPLAEDSGVTSIEQLGLSGANIQQFKPLAHWPNGNIKWVLVDTQVSIRANGRTTLNLVAGKGNAGGAELARDNSDHIFVDTGIAQFKIRKNHFNIFEKVVVNGKELVSPGNQGGLSVVGNADVSYKLNGKTHQLHINEIYDSKNDPHSTAIVEENGPVRVVVKAMGAFIDGTGNRLMDYTVRFHFYRNKSYVKTIAVIRNGAREDDHPIKKIFSSVQLSIPLNLEREKRFEFATNKGLFSGVINDTASIYQAFSIAHMTAGTESDVIDGKKGWYDPPMRRLTDLVDANYEQKGLEIKNGSTILRPLGDQNDWGGDVAEIKDSANNGLSIAMKYMSSYWPSSFEFRNDGYVEVGIFSKFNSKKDIIMGWGTHETRELMFDFHTRPINNKEVMYRIEQPLVGRASIQHYSNTEVLYGQRGIATATEWDQWFISNYGKLDYYHPKSGWEQTNNGVIVWRTFWYSGVQGTDIPLAYQLTFLKNGSGGRYMGGLQKTRFNVDSGICRTDGFDYSKSLIKTNSLYSVDEKGCYNRGGGKNHFDYSHNHWLGMVTYYYLTGDEDIKEAIDDYLEEFNKVGDLKLATGFNDLRSYSRYYRTIALGYEFNRDNRLKTILEKMTSDILDSRDNPPNLKPYGRNVARGYLWVTSIPREVGPLVHSFFLISIHVQDVWEGLRVLKKYNSAYPRTEELEDYLLGISQFVFNELYLEDSSKRDFGYLYDYLLHNSNEWTNAPVGTKNYIRKDDSSRAMLFAYSKSGDAKYLERGKRILAVGGGSGSSTPYPAHELIYVDLHGTDSIWKYIDTVNVINNGNNKYTLSWKVPDGALAYQIKYSDKPIVDWLGFDQLTRNYLYSPDNHTPFFAAVNVDNEPLPVTSGSIQTYTIDIAQAINSYNSVRNLSPGNPSYVNYDPRKTYYFAIKYQTKGAQKAYKTRQNSPHGL